MVYNGFQIDKVGFVFLMDISSDISIWQHRGDDHHEEDPHFIIAPIYTSYKIKVKSIPEVVAT